MVEVASIAATNPGPITNYIAYMKDKIKIKL